MNRISMTLKELNFLWLLSGDMWEETVRYVNLTVGEEAQTFTLPREMPQAPLKFKLITPLY